METKLHFNFKDVFRAARLGFAGKKMAIHFGGFVLGWVIYLVLIYLALMLKGMTIGEIWSLFGLFPLPFVGGMPRYCWLLAAAAGLICLIIWLITSTAVARVTYQQLKGNEFYSIKDSLNFVKKNWKAVFLSPLSLVIFIAFLILCGAVIGLIAKIPYVGELGFAILFNVPILIVAVFTIFLGIVFAISLILTPAIVATTGEDTFETIIQLFSTTWSQPWRLVIYELVLKWTQLVAMVIFSWFTVRGFALILRVCGWWMGPKLTYLTVAAGKYLPRGAIFDLPILSTLVRIPFSPNFSAHISFGDAPPQDMVWTMDWAGCIIGFMLIFAAFFVFSYGASITSVGQTLIYLILRMKKDDENLLERKDEEEEFEEEKREEEKKEEKVEEKPKKEEKTEEKATVETPEDKKESMKKEEEKE